MTSRPRTVLLTLVGPPLCGVLLACMVMAAWVGVGLPLAKGETWLTVQKVPPVAGASFTSGQPDQLQFFLVPVVIVFLLMILIIITQSLKTVRKNPTETLRYE